ncbi:unnamed protein product [Rangifer tarandus platyrhynchus]|uniref:Uncharacterized protein n=2 Tax=Rangifer tarandus platyrhynchus TaxID=3082113 RepID=A0ABN8ZHH3_RANTA|nr:unnamed protein product [Rangifer tarandus platyrhynchus]CAI9707629.1 unnamed protein product [Rangifer tarandus platyrhynchus]
MSNSASGTGASCVAVSLLDSVTTLKGGNTWKAEATRQGHRCCCLELGQSTSLGMAGPACSHPRVLSGHVGSGEELELLPGTPCPPCSQVKIEFTQPENGIALLPSSAAGGNHRGAAARQHQAALGECGGLGHERDVGATGRPCRSDTCRRSAGRALQAAAPAQPEHAARRRRALGCGHSQEAGPSPPTKTTRRAAAAGPRPTLPSLPAATDRPAQGPWGPGSVWARSLVLRGRVPTLHLHGQQQTGWEVERQPETRVIRK